MRLVSSALAGSVEGSPEMAVLMLDLDLDRYRSVRNSFGPAAGDELLGAVAGRLSASLRHGDVLARLGEDEFAVLLRGIVDITDATIAANRLIDCFQRPIGVHGGQVLVRASVGVVIVGPDAVGPEQVLRDAEVAMVRAQAEGGDRWATFEPAMHTVALARFDMEQALGEAIDLGQLVIEFQPLVALAGSMGQARQIRQVEALVRWRHPVRGIIAPSDFLPLAEVSGLIVPLGGWALREAVRQARIWQLMDDAHAQLMVGVNLSARQLFHPGLLPEVAETLRGSGLAPSTLVLEITENALIRDPDGTIRTLRALRELGVRIALDDFGTGSSSLSQLTRLPLDALKIDRSLMAGLTRDAAEAAVVRTLVHLGRALHLETIAVGVETRAQLVALRGMGCDMAQGFLFGKPLGPDGITSLLRAERRRAASWARAR